MQDIIPRRRARWILWVGQKTDAGRDNGLLILLGLSATRNNARHSERSEEPHPKYVVILSAAKNPAQNTSSS